jgi:hypothetical protein
MVGAKHLFKFWSSYNSLQNRLDAHLLEVLDGYVPLKLPKKSDIRMATFAIFH